MQEERKMILKMIEDGKITAEEGLQLLNALKDDTVEAGGEEATEQAAQSKEISTDVDWSSGASYSQAEKKSPSFAARFSDFVEDAIQKIKEFDLDFNFGSSVEVEHVFQHQDAQIEKVDISIENGNLLLRPWDENDVRIECQVKVFKVKDQDEARNTFIDVIDFSVKDQVLKFHSPKKSMKVNTIVYVPKNHLEEVNLYVFNGKVNGEGALVSRDIDVKTVNGAIEFEKIVTQDGDFETANGAITIPKLDAVHSEAKTINGTVKVGALQGKFDGETLSGTIEYSLLEPADARAYIKTTTGSVIVQVPDNVKTEGKLKTTVGGIHCKLDDFAVVDEKKEFANNKMSFLSNKSGEYSFYVEAEATTGSVTVKRSEESSSQQ